MADIKSYYLYQKYIKYPSNPDWIPAFPSEYSVSGDTENPMPLVVKETAAVECGYKEDETIYRWFQSTQTGDTVCYQGDKYYKEYYQVSYDNGVTWQNVSPEQSRRSSVVYQYDVDDCYEYKWTNMDISTDYICSGTSKYYKQIKQRRYIEGGTWEDVTPAEYQSGDLYEVDSTDCGYVPLNYLVFVPISGDTTFTFNSSKNKTVDYSLDSGTTWTTLSSGGTTPTVSAGNKVYWRAEWGSGSALADNGKFLASNYFNVEGNIMSLASGDTVEVRQFSRLFSGNTYIVNAENLSLPTTTLTMQCYASMFDSCTSLTTAPQLPATTLATGCYSGMFQGCTSLTTAPALPATTLAKQCYINMFYNCTSLTTAPELPATTLAINCYGAMFGGCTSLTTAPALPATELADNCYQYMLSRCTSLTTAPALPATTLARSCYDNMFDGCTSLTTAPELPATTLANYCYQGMFDSCTSLTTAPELPATTLATGCYSSMFDDCSNLNSITCLATNISATNCTSYWLFNVSSSGTFYKNASMSSWPTGASGIPNGWTVQNAS